MREIMIFLENKTVDGFTVQPGFTGIIENGQLVAVTSGHSHNNGVDEFLFIYRKNKAGQWVGRWDYVNESEAGSLYDALNDYQKMAEIWDAVRYLNDNKPKIFTDSTTLWDGEKWAKYNPLNGLPGVYLVTWKDKTGCKSEYKALTVRTYRKMNKLS